jgi:nucleotide-binding universal stress UspA family protein
MLESIKRNLPDGISASTALGTGSPAQSIVDYAHRHGADLLVLGAQGRGATQFFFGSVVERVLRLASCPVLVTRGPETAPLVPFPRVLVGVDFSDVSEACARAAVTLATTDGCVKLIHVIKARFEDPDGTRLIHDLRVPFKGAPHYPEHDEPAGRAPGRKAPEGLARQVEALQRCRDLWQLGIITVCTVELGNPAAVIMDRAQASHADLIVVGSRAPRGVREKLLGTVADRVLRHAPLPVLFVPSTGESSDRAVFPSLP